MTEVTPGAANEVVANPGTEVVETKAPETIITQETTKVEPSQWYANDWREKMAGGDAKELARLQRFTDPSAVFKSYRDLEGKVSSGALKQEVDLSKLDEAGLKAWREANGIPQDPGDYNIKLPDGLVLSNEDQIILGNVLQTMHQQGRKPAEVEQTINSFLEARELQIAAAIENEKASMVQTQEVLRQEWQGADYLTNLGAVKNMLASAGEFGQQLEQARLPNGQLLGNSVEGLKWLASLALELNPAGTVVPGTGANQMESIQTEKQALEAEMKKDINAWRKNEAGRARHRELIDAELKLKSRGY